MPDSVTQILRSGPVGSKKNIAVLGDGFAAADQTAYNNKVKELLIDGVFGHDYFYEDMQAFNIFRVNLISTDSGVSKRVYDEKGTPADGSDDTITSNFISLLQTEATFLQDADRANVVLCYVSVERTICHQMQESGERPGVASGSSCCS